MRNSPSAMVAPRRRTESSEGRERRKPLPLPMRPGAYGLRVIGYGGYRLWQLLLMLCLLYIYIYMITRPRSPAPPCPPIRLLDRYATK
jgi:hypothetical protein